MEQEPSTPNLKIYKAFIQAQGELKSVSKDAKNPHFKSKYATLASTQEAVRPILLKHGLAVMQLLKNGEEKGYQIVTILLHDSGEKIETTLSLLIDKNSMQGLGSATTYAKRYALQALLGISASEDDDDGNGAPPQPQNKPQSSTPPPKQTLPKYQPYQGPAQEFLMPFGTVKGRPLKDLDLDALGKIRSYTSSKLTAKPQTGNIPQIADVHKQVKAMQLILMPVDTPPHNEAPNSPPPHEQEPEGLGMDDFGQPPESTQDVIDEMNQKYGGK